MLLTLLTLTLPPALNLESHDEPMTGSDRGNANFHYTYIEVDAALVDPDYSGSDSEVGFQLLGSAMVWRDLFVRASYLGSGGDADLSLFKVGAGWAIPIQKNLDLYGLLSLAHTEVGNGDDTGWALEGGARFMPSEKFELNGLVEVVDYDDSDLGFGLGGRYYFNEKVSAGLNFETTGDFADIWYLGVRWNL